MKGQTWLYFALDITEQKIFWNEVTMFSNFKNTKAELIRANSIDILYILHYHIITGMSWINKSWKRSLISAVGGAEKKTMSDCIEKGAIN